MSVFWLLLRLQILPPWNSPFVVYGLPLAILITAGLGLASLIEQLVKSATAALKRRRAARENDQKIAEHQRKFVEHIPYMTKDERAIFGYLLTNSQKSFTAEMDGGHAASLYKRQFIQTDAQVGLSYGLYEFPFSVPDHIWSVLGRVDELTHVTVWGFPPEDLSDSWIADWNGGSAMSTKMNEADWELALDVFRACLPARGAKAKDDRLFLE